MQSETKIRCEQHSKQHIIGLHRRVGKGRKKPCNTASVLYRRGDARPAGRGV
nr:MAG TPA: hypothetical protein [Caudoviricetes sp.]